MTFIDFSLARMGSCFIASNDAWMRREKFAPSCERGHYFNVTTLAGFTLTRSSEPCIQILEKPPTRVIMNVSDQ